MGKHELELNRLGEVNESGFCELSTDMETDSVHSNIILQTPTRDDQKRKPQTLSASDPSNSAGDHAPGRAGPITRSRKRFALSQREHAVSHRPTRMTRSYYKKAAQQDRRK